MAQHGSFFAADADCVPLTRAVAWALRRQWLDLVARSGTALFISADPAIVTTREKAALKSAFASAVRAHEPGVPLDTPERSQLNDKQTFYDWYAEETVPG